MGSPSDLRTIRQVNHRDLLLSGRRIHFSTYRCETMLYARAWDSVVEAVSDKGRGKKVTARVRKSKKYERKKASI
jgi:hypothetical protein